MAVAKKKKTRRGLIPIDGARVRDIRERRFAWTRLELAQRIGKSESAVQAIESGATPSVYLKTFRAIGEAFGYDLETARLELSPRLDNNVPPVDRSRVVEIPTFDLSVAAGNWVHVPEVGRVCDDRLMDRGLFRVRVRGDSMTPRFADGDLVEFRCLIDGLPLEIGACYYVQRDDGEATFKQLAEVRDEVLILRAINAEQYPDPIPVERRAVIRMAKAVAIIREL